MSLLAVDLPWTAFHPISLDWSLVISLVLGIGFGFSLERAGFGSSKVLSSIFYLEDWRVLKVMFTAIVTAMLGLYAADGLGWLAMNQVAIKSTFLWGQIVGGFVLGMGFVTAGYCPGTAMVGFASGKLDALVTMVGIVLGIGVFEEGFAWVKPLYEAAYLGEVRLPEWLGLPTSVVVVLVALLALASFVLVEWLERRTRGAHLFDRGLLRRTTALVGAAALVALTQLLGPGSARAMGTTTDPSRTPDLEPLELAAWIVEGRPTFQVLDLRGPDAQPALLGAMPIAFEDLRDARRRPPFPPERLLVIVDETGGERAHEAAAALRAAELDSVVLRGGARAFAAEVLSESVRDGRARAYRILASGAPVFGSAPPPPPKTKKAPPKRKHKKSTGC